MKPRVFVFERVNPALKVEQCVEAFGQVIYLFEREDERTSLWDTKELQREIQEQLTALEFNPAIDYFAVVGPVVPCVLAVSAIQFLHDEYKLLFWNSINREYFARLIHNERKTTKC